MSENPFDMPAGDIAWCPGCGNFPILMIIKQALQELGRTPESTALVSGIGQAAKMPQYVNTNFFNGLHGRALPVATGVKAANPSLTVIAESGDGDMYGEGGNHFLHCIRRNPDITNIVHTNMVYGLTKGQASPTSQFNFKTPVQVDGVILEPFNPPAVAIGLNASFVARAFSADRDRAVEIIKQAITHPGYALVDILHPCVSFNKVNTLQWFKEHSRYVEDAHDPSDRTAAFALATNGEYLPLGVIYKSNPKKPFEQMLAAYDNDDRPLYQRDFNQEAFEKLVAQRTGE